MVHFQIAASSGEIIIWKLKLKIFLLETSFSIEFGSVRLEYAGGRMRSCENTNACIWQHTYSNAQQSVQKMWFKFEWKRSAKLIIGQKRSAASHFGVQLSRIFQFSLEYSVHDEISTYRQQDELPVQSCSHSTPLRHANDFKSSSESNEGENKKENMFFVWEMKLV